MEGSFGAEDTALVSGGMEVAKANLQKLFVKTTYEQMVEAYLVEIKCHMDDPGDLRGHAKIARSLFSIGAIMFGDRWLRDSRVTASIKR